MPSLWQRPCYVYLQLKMPGYKGTITVHGSRKIDLECEEGDAAYVESVCATEELKFMLTRQTWRLWKIQQQSMILRWSLNRQMKLSWLTLFLATHLSSSASVLIWIRNRKARSSSSSMRTGTSLHGSLQTCQVYQGNLLSTLTILIQTLNRSNNSFVALMKRGVRPLVKKWPALGSWIHCWSFSSQMVG